MLNRLYQTNLFCSDLLWFG